MKEAILQAIAERRSNRGYAGRQISEEQLSVLVEAAKQAPSARNALPWHMTVAQDRALLDAFALDYALLINPNPEKVDIVNGYHLFFHAPTVIFFSTPKEPPTRFVQVDCGIAVQNIALAAVALGLGSVILGRPMDVFNSAKGPGYEKALHFPEGNSFAIAIAVGEPTLSKEAHAVREGLVSRV